MLLKDSRLTPSEIAEKLKIDFSVACRYLTQLKTNDLSFKETLLVLCDYAQQEIFLKNQRVSECSIVSVYLSKLILPTLSMCHRTNK